MKGQICQYHLPTANYRADTCTQTHLHPYLSCQRGVNHKAMDCKMILPQFSRPFFFISIVFIFSLSHSLRFSLLPIGPDSDRMSLTVSLFPLPLWIPPPMSTSFDTCEIRKFKYSFYGILLLYYYYYMPFVLS